MYFYFSFFFFLLFQMPRKNMTRKVMKKVCAASAHVFSMPKIYVNNVATAATIVQVVSSINHFFSSFMLSGV